MNIEYFSPLLACCLLGPPPLLLLPLCCPLKEVCPLVREVGLVIWWFDGLVFWWFDDLVIWWFVWFDDLRIWWFDDFMIWWSFLSWYFVYANQINNMRMWSFQWCQIDNMRMWRSAEVKEVYVHLFVICLNWWYD